MNVTAPTLDDAVRFDGATFEPDSDGARLGAQLRRVFALMADGSWRTLVEIGACTGDPPASVSARLRDFRKARFGAHTVERRARGERDRGLFEYRLRVNEGNHDDSQAIGSRPRLHGDGGATASEAGATDHAEVRGHVPAVRA